MVRATSKWIFTRIGEDSALRWKNVTASAMPFSTHHHLADLALENRPDLRSRPGQSLRSVVWCRTSTLAPFTSISTRRLWAWPVGVLLLARG